MPEDKPKQPYLWKSAFLIGGTFLFIYYIFLKDHKPTAPDNSYIPANPAIEKSVQSTFDNENPIAVQLAILHADGKPASKFAVREFTMWLYKLHAMYPHISEKEIGNNLAHGWNIALKKGLIRSLLHFTKEFYEYVNDINSKADLVSIHDDMALYIKYFLQRWK